MVGRIPRRDVDPDAGGMDMDSRTNMDTDARSINADGWGINADGWGINADGWGINGRRSHIVGLVDVGAPRVPAPLGRLGSLRPNQR